MQKDRDSIIAKIRKLLEVTTEQGATQAEAISAALAAQKLVAKYAIDSSELEDNDDSLGEIGEYSSGIKDGKQIHSVLASTIAKNFRCRCYRTGRSGRWETMFYGYERDAQAAKLTYQYLLEVMKKQANKEIRFAKKQYGSASGVYNASCAGFIAGVNKELEKQSYALMLVIPKEVNEAYESISQGFKKARAVTINSGYNLNNIYERGEQSAKDAINSRTINAGGGNMLESSAA